MSQELMQALASMSAKDLKEVQARTAFLLQGQQQDEKVDEAIKVVFHQMSIELREKGHLDIPPLKVVLQGKAGKGLRNGSKYFIQYIEQYFQPEKKIDKLHGVQLLLRMLIRRLERDSIPVTVTTLAQQLSKINVVVEDEFPGYRQSGFLPLLLKKFRLDTVLGGSTGSL